MFASTWTDLEMGVAVISGNLPLLAPLFDNFFRNRGSSKGRYGTTETPGSRSARSRADRITASKSGAHATVTSSGHLGKFDRLSDSESQTVFIDGHDIEMDDRAILVNTQINVTSQQVDETAKNIL